jgi:hypothetical protein
MVAPLFTDFLKNVQLSDTAAAPSVQAMHTELIAKAKLRESRSTIVRGGSSDASAASGSPSPRSASTTVSATTSLSPSATPTGKRRSMIDTLQLMIPLVGTDNVDKSTNRTLNCLISPRGPASTTAASANIAGNTADSTAISTYLSPVEDLALNSISRFEKDNRALRMENAKLQTRITKLEVRKRLTGTIDTSTTCRKG